MIDRLQIGGNPYHYLQTMYLLNPRTFFALLFLCTDIFAVDITISPPPGPPFPNGQPGHVPFIAQRCPDIPPGHCCKQRPDNPQAISFPNKRIIFTGLDALDIASAWANRSAVGGCSGLPIATYAGGGTWQYDVPEGQNEQIIRGGNYFRMPIGSPEANDKGWLSGEGVLGFVWGTGDWWSQTPNPNAWANLQAAARAQLGGNFPSDLRAFGPGSKKVRRRANRLIDRGVLAIGRRGLERKLIGRMDEGLVFCKSPEQTRWPDVITIDGVEYRTQTPQGDIYLSQDGKVLNYTGT